LGAIVGSTPAFMDPPSLDPPPDADYPAFVDEHKERRTLIFVGANDGMMHAIDARSGLEVWAFIPFNLLPKLRTLRDGQSPDAFDYFVDSSAKVADVKVDGQWRTVLLFGQGPGGTFYQAFDVTLDTIASVIQPDADADALLLSYFSNASRIPFLWAFPRYSHFDPALGKFGDLKSTAADYEKSVGQTWSDPAVGQVGGPNGKYTVITGSGFFPRSAELAANRGGAGAGRALYLLDAGTGDFFDWEVVPADGLAEDADNCLREPYGCTKFKNAIQADPVATGPSDSRYINKAYVGDLDGNVWRFDIGLSGTQDSDGLFLARFMSSAVNLNPDAAPEQPIYASMAAVAIGPDQYLFYGTGSDLLPTRGVDTAYRLVGLLDGGGSGTITFSRDLARVDGEGDDEVVSSFPAVAGDIVFFSTTTYKPETPWVKPDANLYALTFIGGAAYDSSGNNKIEKNESPKVRTLEEAGRATAPFIVDQHLVFGAGDQIELFGDPTDFNNGVGQVGVRILSWREIR
ncbi:MAG TPA: PilC/PilY family type IV pilus protein, partial [Methylomirabilota bacterium]